MACLVSTVCIFSMTLITYPYLSYMACPKRVVSWANTVCVHWTGHDALESALINDVATPPIVTSWIDIISLMFLFNHSHVISKFQNFPMNDLCHDSIGNKLLEFVFSRSDEPIVIGVCGMRSADQDHRIVSEPIASGSFLESGPVYSVDQLNVSTRSYPNSLKPSGAEWHKCANQSSHHWIK